jgi:hypothetical protein
VLDRGIKFRYAGGMKKARQALLIAETILSFGLNLLIRRMGMNPRWRYALWTAIAINEARGLALVYGFGRTIFRAATGI